jgi:hypothetical protein
VFVVNFSSLLFPLFTSRIRMAAEAAQRQSVLVNSGGWLQKPGRLVCTNWKRRHMHFEKHHSSEVVLAIFETKGGKQKGDFVLHLGGGGGGAAAAAAELEREGKRGFRVLGKMRTWDTESGECLKKEVGTFRLRAATAAEADDWVAVLGLGAAAIAERLPRAVEGMAAEMARVERAYADGHGLEYPLRRHSGQLRDEDGDRPSGGGPDRWSGCGCEEPNRHISTYCHKPKRFGR